MKNIVFVTVLILAFLLIGCGKKVEEPRVEKTSDTTYKLILNDSYVDALARFLETYPQLKLVTKTEYPPDKDVLEYFKKGDMQYPYFAWGDFNKDGYTDFCCLFVTKINDAGYYSHWWVVVFEGAKNGEFQYKVITNQIVASYVNGIMYHQKNNSVEFSAIGKAAGQFHWDGQKYVVENPGLGGD